MTALLLMAALAVPAFAAEPDAFGPPTAQTALKYVRDSAEYHALATQVYRQATAALPAAAKGKGPWAVVLDVDETVLDNSVYQLERVTYGFDYTSPSWEAWCRRKLATPVPGAVAFTEAVRAAGGRVVYVTNRKAVVGDATRENLQAVGLWAEGDSLCPRTGDSSKRARRDGVRGGAGECSLGKPHRVAMYLGDQMGDFPEDGEDGGARLELVGTRAFLLPNPLYGDWVFREQVTRPLP
jgi:5'-nucleotidase (lipoprotein e(P4) family)